MSLHEIVLPSTKPETEWIRGRALQKVSPQRDHSRLQRALIARLDPWARSRGEMGPEWRFRIKPPVGPIRPLVPDISFVRNERIAHLSDADIQVPLLAPDVAFEILSPGDRRVDVDDKVAVLLSAGTELVAVVDPLERRVEMHDGSGVRMLVEGEAIEHPALDGFSYAVSELFAELRRARSV
jgi:Uma2 family endonuclease